MITAEIVKQNESTIDRISAAKGEAFLAEIAAAISHLNNLARRASCDDREYVELCRVNYVLQQAGHRLRVQAFIDARTSPTTQEG